MALRLSRSVTLNDVIGVFLFLVCVSRLHFTQAISPQVFAAVHSLF